MPLSRFTWVQALFMSCLMGLCHVLIFYPSVSKAQDFQELRTRYFVDRSVEYAEKRLLREEILSLLYRCTTDEIEARQKEGTNPALLTAAPSAIPRTSFDRNAPGVVDADIAERYHLWVAFEDGEYRRRSQTLLAMRSILIENAAPDQKKRMFRREMEQALVYYADSDWDPARYLLEHLLNDYGYRWNDDILFYLGQVCIQQSQYDAALEYLLKLIEANPRSTYLPKSYDQATELLSQLNEDRSLVGLYRAYLKAGAPGAPAEMSGLHIRAARAEVNSGRYRSAVAMLERVDPGSPYYLASRYLLAECLTLQENWSRAVAVLEDLLTLKREGLPYDRWRMFIDEARIKLAYIYYQWGDYKRASELFKQVKTNSAFHDRALLGHAWIAFQLDKYEETVQNTEEILHFYPYSSEIYEARSLAGYCYERMGDETYAMTHFFAVLEAGVGQSKLHTFMVERQRLAETLNRLKTLEDDLFSSDDTGHFEAYKRTRNNLEINRLKISLAEMLDMNARMRGLVEERVLLDKLIGEAGAVEEDVILADNAALIARFLKLENRIQFMLAGLETMRKEQMVSTPLYYREAYLGHLNETADSLSVRIEVEIASLRSSIAETDRLYREALEASDPERSLHFGLRLEREREALNRSYEMRTAAEEAIKPALKTRVERWSDYSFGRFAMGGMEFEELDRKVERLQQVEDYILTLMEMLEKRKLEKPSLEVPDSSGVGEAVREGTGE
jgi:tetratricopeptide (TPR) repeat protein